MKKLYFVFLSFGLLISASVSAGTVKKSLVSKYVDDYYYSIQMHSSATNPQDCYPTRPTCVDAVCDRLGSFGCDSMDEINQVNAACRGNYNGNCINVACNKLGSMGCDRIDDVVVVARSCVGNHDIGCFESVCRRLGTFGCNDLKKVEEVLKSCAGNN